MARQVRLGKGKTSQVGWGKIEDRSRQEDKARQVDRGQKKSNQNHGKTSQYYYTSRQVKIRQDKSRMISQDKARQVKTRKDQDKRQGRQVKTRHV